MMNTFLGHRFDVIVACVLLGLWLPRLAFSNPAVYERGDDPGVGFNLIAWYNQPDNPGTPQIEGEEVWKNAVQEIYNAGFREVSLSPVRFVNIDTGAILATSPKGPELSHVAAGVARAKSLGMRVTLNPFVELFDANGLGTGDDEYFADVPGGCTWRGCWNPTPGGAIANQFWSDYRNYLTSVAQVATTYNVEAMTVGTEYNAIDADSGHNANWSEVIDAMRAEYGGLLGYAANWDHYNHTNVRESIWSHPEIDFLGIDAYFTNLVSTSQADNSGTYPNSTFLNTTTTAWSNKLNNEILPYAASQKDGAGMPVVFTEIGYLPYNRTARTPQNSSGAIDADEQSMAFFGLINALDGKADVFHAMHIWQWAMPGSDGSLWNMDPTLPANQPNNVLTAQRLAAFANTAVLPLPGDYNRDGTVDVADYVVWRSSTGKRLLNYHGADGNGDGIVDDGDYGVWRANFGGTIGAVSGSLAIVPEPACLRIWTGLLFGIIAASPARRRERILGVARATTVRETCRR